MRALTSFLLFFVLAASLASLALGSLQGSDKPSDHIFVEPLPASVALSGATEESLAYVASINEPLKKEERKPTKDLGYYFSEKREVNQDDEKPAGVPEKLLNFSEAEPVALNKTSVGNSSGNFTMINDTYVWY